MSQIDRAFGMLADAKALGRPPRGLAMPFGVIDPGALRWRASADVRDGLWMRNLGYALPRGGVPDQCAAWPSLWTTRSTELADLGAQATPVELYRYKRPDLPRYLSPVPHDKAGVGYRAVPSPSLLLVGEGPGHPISFRQLAGSRLPLDGVRPAHNGVTPRVSWGAGQLPHPHARCEPSHAHHMVASLGQAPMDFDDPHARARLQRLARLRAEQARADHDGLRARQPARPEEVTVTSLHPSTYMPTKMVLEEPRRARSTRSRPASRRPRASPSTPSSRA